MTPDKQRVAIATALYPHFPCYWDGPNLRHRYPQYAPETSGPAHDYLNDLNACHEMEQTLRDNQFHYVNYFGNLYEIVTGCEWDGDIGYFGFNLITATAAQRCEAFLKTLELWEESQ